VCPDFYRPDFRFVLGQFNDLPDGVTGATHSAPTRLGQMK
jgi:hypothetical protein